MTKINDLQALFEELKDGEEEVIQARRKSVEMFFLPNTYYIKKPDHVEGKLRYTKVGKNEARDYLVNQGFSSRGTPEKLSEASKELLLVREEREVLYAGPIPGRKAGWIEKQNILATTSMSDLPVDPEGDCEFLRGILAAIFKEPLQFHVFESWLHKRLQAVQTSTWCFNQVLILVGVPNSGKGLIHKLIAETLGGTVTNAYGAVTSERFNAELFRANTLQIEDLPVDRQLEKRDRLASFFLEIAVNEERQCHEKQQTPVNLVPIQALVVSLNDEDHRIQCLPPLTKDLAEKVIILRTYDNEAVRVEVIEQQEFMGRLMDQVPAYRHYLAQYEIPEEVRYPRFGVYPLHDPLVADLLDEREGHSPVVSAIIRHYQEQDAVADKLIRSTEEVYSEVFEQGDELAYHDFFQSHTLDSLAQELGRIHATGSDPRFGKKKVDDLNKWIFKLDHQR